VLSAAGYWVRTLSLDQPSKGQWSDDVETRIGDVTDKSAVQSAVQGVNAVIHLAALLHIVNPPPELREKYERVNIGGTAMVVDAAIKAGVKRLVLFSTIAVYGAQMVACSMRCRQLILTLFMPRPNALPNRVLNARGAEGKPLGTVLRLGAVYGSRIKGNYRRLLQTLARGRFIAVGDGSNRRTLVYDKDLARAAVVAVSHPTAAESAGFDFYSGRVKCSHPVFQRLGLEWLPRLLQESAQG